MEIGGTRLVFPLLALSKGSLRSVRDEEGLLTCPRQDLSEYARMTLVDSAGVLFEIRGAVPAHSVGGRFRSALGFLGVRLRVRFLAHWRAGRTDLPALKARVAKALAASGGGPAAEARSRLEAAQSIREIIEIF